MACHTADDGAPNAGGHAIETRFGTFYGPNITPDPEHGVGAWSFDDFKQAMRHGRRPDGKSYYPAFPYPSYTQMTDEDLQHLWAWMQSVDADPRPNQDHDLRPGYRSRALLPLWRLTGFRRGPFQPDASEPEDVSRGRYLGEAIGHCGDCHTPRGRLGQPRRRLALAGSQDPPHNGPNLTPHPDGLGDWSESDLLTFFSFGMTPEGDFVGGHMMRIVEEGTARLSDEDRTALTAWLRSVRPRPTPR